jgi:hypothetical protein
VSDLSPADLTRVMRHLALRRVAQQRAAGSGVCPRCGQPVPETRSAYCSDRCSMAARNSRRRPKTP